MNLPIEFIFLLTKQNIENSNYTLKLISFSTKLFTSWVFIYTFLLYSEILRGCKWKSCFQQHFGGKTGCSCGKIYLPFYCTV